MGGEGEGVGIEQIVWVGVAELIKLIVVRSMLSITDRGDDMSFPIIFIMSMLSGTHCDTTSDSTLLWLLHSDNVYLWENIPNNKLQNN